MKQNKNIQTTPIESLPGYTVDDSLDPGMAELTTYIPGQASPITVRGDAELLREDFRRQVAAEAKRPAVKAVQKPVEVPVAVPTPEPEYRSLADLNGREIARLERKAWLHDVKTLGRTSMRKLFVQKLHEEQDARLMMELGIIEAVHCRLHERVIARARGMR